MASPLEDAGAGEGEGAVRGARELLRRRDPDCAQELPPAHLRAARA